MAFTRCCRLQGEPSQVRGKLERDLVPALKVNWCLWIPAQFINFKFVPPNLRVRDGAVWDEILRLKWSRYGLSCGSSRVSAHGQQFPGPVAAAEIAPRLVPWSALQACKCARLAPARPGAGGQHHRAGVERVPVLPGGLSWWHGWGCHWTELTGMGADATGLSGLTGL